MPFLQDRQLLESLFTSTTFHNPKVKLIELYYSLEKVFSDNNKIIWRRFCEPQELKVHYILSWLALSNYLLIEPIKQEGWKKNKKKSKPNRQIDWQRNKKVSDKRLKILSIFPFIWFILLNSISSYNHTRVM